ncbi:hypothetical protein [Allorhizobium taibaishanense]|uniref:Uncharacterized protein n=1 Tax=Allorhizobium taibaishanense TaxID=887144 RepID=A0A7W6MVY4_9HYPH|nr:hypothetical protein [Allorhizobium taibaishanense]MBB4009679.1 hypothetical protein [Allorhizobium taibaishanense]
MMPDLQFRIVLNLEHDDPDIKSVDTIFAANAAPSQHQTMLRPALAPRAQTKAAGHCCPAA